MREPVLDDISHSERRRRRRRGFGSKAAVRTLEVGARFNKTSRGMRRRRRGGRLVAGRSGPREAKISKFTPGH